MCQAVVRRLYNPSKRCHVRKVAHLLAQALRSDRFPIATEDDKKKIYPQVVADKFTSVFPNEPVTCAINDLMDDQGFKAWKDLRNILAHRSSPGRHFAITLGGGEEHRTSQWAAMRVDENL